MKDLVEDYTGLYFAVARSSHEHRREVALHDIVSDCGRWGDSPNSAALKREKKRARRVLILTATPFSIRLDELRNMLQLIGGEAASAPVRSFSRALDDLYAGNTARSSDVVAERLAKKARTAVDALSTFVVRHSISDLKGEQTSFGYHEEWNIEVPKASPEEIELMLRMDRALRIGKDGARPYRVTNDPRFHVGWRHFDVVRDYLERRAQKGDEPVRNVVAAHHLKAIDSLRGGVGTHTKMVAVGEKVKAIVDEGEKVLLFCHHHATAQELTTHLASVLPKVIGPRTPSLSVWRKAWDGVLAPASEENRDERLRETFIDWLCTDLVRMQTRGWLNLSSTSKADLIAALEKETGRCREPKKKYAETVAAAAQRLYNTLLQSRSSRAVLQDAENLPGAGGDARVLGICTPSDNEGEESLFIHNQQPDTVISIFNSPFGPDVLVVTDKLSEGIDLHRYCRHLIHYELDPSPIRTVQRNGRLRRVNSWAAVMDKPIRYAYPAFRGTRDYRLVQIMKKRIDSFSLLLGGVQDFVIEEVAGVEEKWRNEVIRKAKTSLISTGGRLRARNLGGT